MATAFLFDVLPRPASRMREIGSSIGASSVIFVGK